LIKDIVLDIEPPPLEEFKRLMESLGPDGMFDEEDMAEEEMSEIEKEEIAKSKQMSDEFRKLME
jgi:hypothetical protein